MTLNEQKEQKPASGSMASVAGEFAFTVSLLSPWVAAPGPGTWWPPTFVE